MMKGEKVEIERMKTLQSLFKENLESEKIVDRKIARQSNNLVEWINLVWKRLKHISRYIQAVMPSFIRTVIQRSGQLKEIVAYKTNLGEIFEELTNMFLQGPNGLKFILEISLIY